ncbi:MAG: D-alanyl-D-alanine carboxypeptidase family protein [Sarcina sp.]
MTNKINKISAIILSMIMTLFVAITPISVLADEKENPKTNSALDVDAKSALLMEVQSGKIIFEKNSNEKFAPASVTKIMTMLLTMEAIDSGKINLSDKVTISENAKKMGGSTMLLDTGEIRTVEELLKGVAIASGNDAAVALGEYLAGSEDAFVELMNKRAQEIGMKNSTFKNCTGLPINGHLSTAFDISIMSRELLKHEGIFKYSGTYMETISEGRKSPIELVNHNKLVRFFKGCDGLKTGFTNEAKYCISATAKKDGTRVLAVIMGAPTYKVRNRDASMLMNYGFSKFETSKILEKDTEVQKYDFDKKGNKCIILKSSKDLNITYLKGEKENIKKVVELDDIKEFKENQKAGKCKFYLNDQLIGEVELYSDRDLNLNSLLEKIKIKITNMMNN